MGNCFPGARKLHEVETIDDDLLLDSERTRPNGSKMNLKPHQSTYSRDVVPSQRMKSTFSTYRSVSDRRTTSYQPSVTTQFSEAVNHFPNVLSLATAQVLPELKHEVPQGCRIVEDSVLLDQIGSLKGTDYFRGESEKYGLSLVKCITVGVADEDTEALFNTELEMLSVIQRSSRKNRSKNSYRTKGPFKSGYEDHVYKYQHDNIIGFIGYMEASVGNTVQRRLITEFYVDTLREHVRHRTNKGRRDMKHYEASLYAFQMAKGLVALHKLKICHRDLNTENIIMGLGLLDKEYKNWLRYIAKEESRKAYENYAGAVRRSRSAHDRVMQPRQVPTAAMSYYKFLKTPPLVAKIANFGYAKNIGTGRTTTVVGSMQFMAPEMMKQEEYSFSADVWSYGCILYEMIKGVAPFNKKPVSHIESRVIHGKFPKADQIGSKEFQSLQTIMRNCLKTEPQLRCRAKELVEDLGKL